MSKTDLEEGAYYPRVARPYNTHKNDNVGRNPEDEEKSKRHEKTRTLAESAGQLHHLKEHLEEICRIIYPCKDNFHAFGHEIRNVLIVACTEVEAQWRGVMKANGYKFEVRNGDEIGSTNEYIRLLPLLRLREYSVRFPFFPAIEKPIKPFENWSNASPGPTKTLDWYAAYNKVKHDREEHFKEAQLGYAFKAAAAYFVMLCAQHGSEVAAPDRVASRKFFHLIDRPAWKTEDCYSPIKNGNKLSFNKCKHLFPPNKVVYRDPPLIIDHTEAGLIPEAALP